MNSLWRFLMKPKNQATLSWIGGGLVVLATGIWAVVVFLLPPSSAPKPNGPTNVSAHQGVAGGGDVSGNTVTITNSGGPAASNSGTSPP